MIKKQRSAFLAVILILAIAALFSAAPVRAENCTGLMPDTSCVLDENVLLGNALTINKNIILTISAGGLAPASLVIGDTINGKNGIEQGDIVTAGNGGTIIQAADVGTGFTINNITINNGDIWYISNNATLFQQFGSINLNGGVLGIGPNSALSMISAGILGSANADTLDFISGGQSLGTTGNISHAGEFIDLGNGDDRFIYYQSAGSTIAADKIIMGHGNNLFGIRGNSVGSIFSGDFTGGQNNGIIAFFSGSTATFGSVTSSIFLGAGDDLIDFDSGAGLAGGTLIASTLDLGDDQDTLLMADNATLQVATLFDTGLGNDLITFTSGGFIDVTGATFAMNDGDDILRFNDISFVPGTSGLDVSGGNFSMGNGNDSIIFVSNSVGLNATGTTILLGAGNDDITFMSSSGLIDIVSGSGFLSVDGGLDTDIISFGSGAVINFGSASGAGNIINVETLDIGNGTLNYTGTIDNVASVINFTSASFLNTSTNIAATITGNANSNSLLFSSGALFSGTANMGGGIDDVTFSSSATLSGAVNLGTGNDIFNFSSGGGTLSGIIDGGGGTDVLNFLNGTTIITGSVLNFSSGIINAPATLNIRNGASTPVPLSGTGTLQFGSAGGAASVFNISSTIDGVNLDVLSDTLVTNGNALGATTALAGLSVNQGALFKVDTDVNASGGILDVDGTVRLSPAITLSADRYNQANAGDFIFEINSDLMTGITTIGQIMINGAGQSLDFSSATGAFDHFNFVLSPTSNGLQADTISFISAGAGGTVTAPEAANITGSNILFDLSLADANANPRDLELVITQLNTVAGLANSKNNEKIANVLLTDLLNSTTPEINTLQTALLNSTNATDFNQVLEGARPVLHGGEIESVKTINKKTFGLINQRLALLRKDSQGQTGISTGNIVKELEAWWQFYAQSAVQNKRDQVSGYKETTAGLAGGVDKEIIDNGVLGLGFSWGDSNSTSKGNGQADTQATSYQLSLYGDYDFGRAYINAMGSYTYNSIGIAKTSIAGKRTAHYHADYFAARLEMGYSFMSGKTRLIPKIMGHYGYYKPDSYEESGPGAQKITGEDLKSLEIGSGLDMNWLIKNDKGSYFVPALRLGYLYNLSNNPFITRTQFFDGGPSIEMRGFNPAKQSIDFGLGMTYFSKEAWELLFNYDLEYKEDYISHTGTIRAAYKFYQ